MTSLIAMLTSGKGSWTHVSRLMTDAEWEKIYLVTNEFGKSKFTSNKPFEFVLIEDRLPFNEIVNAVVSQLSGKISDIEVAVSLYSGNGKEHMALLSAIQKLGLGIRLVASTENGLIEV